MDFKRREIHVVSTQGGDAEAGAPGREGEVLEHDRRRPGRARRPRPTVSGSPSSATATAGTTSTSSRRRAATRSRSPGASSRRGARAGRPTAPASPSTGTKGRIPGARQLGVVEVGGDPRTARGPIVTSGRGTNTMAQWSPDGRQLVYQHTDPWNSADLWTVDVATPNAKPVRLTRSMPSTIDPAGLVEPQLVHYPGPDGKQVPAYLSSRRASTARASTRRSSGSTATG